MKKIYLFRKGGIFNPINTNEDWKNFAYNKFNCVMYIKDNAALAAYLDVWQKMRENNIEMKIVK